MWDVTSVLRPLPEGSHLLAEHPGVSNSRAEPREGCCEDNQREQEKALS